MTENEFLLQDRLEKIRAVDRDFNLREYGYLSFSGGKDSTVVSYLLDEALPGNTIPRVFIDTGLEYRLVTEFVYSMQEKDSRIEHVYSGVNITKMLEKYGYPVASKEHSHKLHIYQNTGWTKTIDKYMRDNQGTKFTCAKSLRYQFSPGFQIKASDACCRKLKKEVAARYMRETKRIITITGMARAEGGQRKTLNCTVFDNVTLRKFHPLAPMTDEWIKWYIGYRNIELCPLYYEPYSFLRTGCRGCPFAKDIRMELDTLERELPKEWENAWRIFGDVYREYAKINYRKMEGIHDPFLQEVHAEPGDNKMLGQVLDTREGE